LHLVRGKRPIERRVPGAAVVLEGGSPVSGGVAAGPVCRVSSALDMLRCPVGAIVVAHGASPRLAVLLPRAAGLIADLGETTGHLATVARETKVPALFATRTATERLAEGTVVTLDADAAVVYAGRVERLLADEAGRPANLEDANRRLLASVTDRITPLTLRDRLASGSPPRSCRTLHDIIRFCHQATIEAMFDIGDHALRRGTHLRRLVTAIPIDCRLFDLGGGISPDAPGQEVTIQQVACRPMRALWAGMTDARLRWNSERPVSLSGFVSAMVNYNFDQDARMRQMGEPSYAFISDDYVNLNSRIGFHFSTVDARLCDVVESNYVSFRFVGGSTGIDQRSRRAVLLHRLLLANGFEADCRADLVNARLRHQPAERMEEGLALVGILMGYVNHLDMALVSDDVMRQYERAFLAGDYGYTGANRDA
jgi:pyruvate,water dikinase